MIIQVGNISADIQNIVEGIAKKLNSSITFNSAAEARALLQEKILEHNVVLIADLNTELLQEDFSLLTAASQKGATLLFANANKDIMTKISGVGVDAKFAIVKSSANQLKQEIVVLLDSQNISVEASTIESTEDLSNQQSDDETSPTSTEPSTSLNQLELFEIKQYNEADIIAYRLKDASFIASEPIPDYVESNPARKDIVYYKIILDGLNYHEHQFKDYWGVRGTLYSVTGCAFNVKMYAPSAPRRKYLQITSEDQVSVTAKNYSHWSELIQLTGWNKGSQNFTARANVVLYPGKYQENKSNIELPYGWTREKIAPQTPNNETQYQSTTGWSISASGGWEGDKPKGSLTAGFESSKVVTTTIPDFGVRNQSTPAVSSWEYYLSQYDKRWQSTLDGVKADLAKGFISLRNESVYDLPSDDNKTHDFTFELRHVVPHVKEIYKPMSMFRPLVTKQHEAVWHFHQTFSFDFSRVSVYES